MRKMSTSQHRLWAGRNLVPMAESMPSSSRCLGTAKPTVPGFYINGNKKVLVTQ